MANQGQFTTGQILTAAELNAFTPLTCLSKAAAQSIPAGGSQVAITFTTEDTDTLNWHSNVTNTERITPTLGGWYQINASGTFDTTVSARIIVAIHKNTSEYVKLDWTGGATANGRTLSAVVYLNGSTDYVRLVVAQYTAGAVDWTQSKLTCSLIRNE